MKYALWNLNPQDPEYLTGPEETIDDAGGHAEGSWFNGQPEQGADILGYVTGEFKTNLSAWNYREITQQEALDFCLAIDPNAYLLPDGKIGSTTIRPIP